MWLTVLVLAAIAVGLYGRFKGLGHWPLGVDEFYILRSIENLLASGLPEYLCGGFYNRGVLYQYVVAALQLGGLTPEFSGRVVSAASSLLVLPAAYLLGKRLHGKTVGLLAVALLSISVWEIEMARFARMYAPFQAIFAWYLLYFLRYTLDRERRALWVMIGLSVLGALVWEGGVLLGLVNLLPPFINHDKGKLRRGDWAFLAGMLVLFALLYVTTLDLRYASDIPALSADYVAQSGAQSTSGNPALLVQLLQQPMWIALALIPLSLTLASLKWIWSFHDRYLLALGLLVAVAAAVTGQLVASLSVLLLLLATRLLLLSELHDKRAAPFFAAIALGTFFWLGFGLLAAELAAPGPVQSSASRALLLIQQVIGFPDLINQVVLPWARAVPLLGAGLFLALVGLVSVCVARGTRASSVTSALLVMLLVLVLAIAAASTPRFETRYTYFLYPLMLTLALVAVAQVFDLLAKNAKWRSPALVGVALLLFAASEDFKPRHIATIDSAETNFRVGMSPSVASHYYPRNDVRGIADWVAGRAGPDDIVLNGIPSVDQYSDRADYVFLDDEDDRYDSFACQRGTVDRWSNRPLLYGNDSLESLVDSGREILIVLYAGYVPRVSEAFRQRGWPFRQESPAGYGGAEVLVLNPD